MTDMSSSKDWYSGKCGILFGSCGIKISVFGECKSVWPPATTRPQEARRVFLSGKTMI